MSTIPVPPMQVAASWPQFRCAQCAHALARDGERGQGDTVTLWCTGCGRRYARINGVVTLLTGEERVRYEP
jgi:hypothetical protein